MPKVSTFYLHARRQQILDAAVACFARRGFHESTMLDICREAELSPGAIYRYFVSKDAIIEASCSDAQETISSLFDSVDPTGIAINNIGKLIDRFFGALTEPTALINTRFAIQLWAEALRSPRIATIILPVINSFRSGIESIIAEGKQQGSINADADATGFARLLQAAYEGIRLQGAIDPDVNLRNYVSTLKHVCQRYLLISQ